ncbi:MAG: glycosyltransferase family 4 protein [Halioglobus sp.]
MPADPNKTILVVNLHYAPFSFGGGTVVAEALAQRLQADHGWRVVVLTAVRDYNLPEYTLRRYAIKDIDIIGVVINSDPDYRTEFTNPRFDAIARQVVAQIQPALCHLHAVQGLGVSWLDSIASVGSKLAITLHDCWWLCDQQFMINSDGNYCNQSSVSHDQCRYCTANFPEFLSRDATLRAALDLADLLLYPSHFHRTLHVDSGFDAEKSRVHKNGINLPQPDYLSKRGNSQRSRRHTVFGFTGGPGRIKGAPFIIKAFENSAITDYSLKVVDSAQNLGTSWQSSKEWKSSVKVEFVPAYSQENMDDFFAQIDVLLFPSQWKESFGLTVREALARDVWVIATDCGAPVEDIVDGENGTIIPFDGSHVGLQLAIESAAERDWQQYENPYREGLQNFDQQAEELDQLFSEQLKVQL